MAKATSISPVNGMPLTYQAVSGTVPGSQSAGFTQAINQKLKVPANLEPYFEEAARTYQIPSALIKSVAKAESDFKATAVSGAGAQGIMQLMPGTARYLGVSNAFDPRENIMGGAKYLREMLDKYDGNTKLALAAYNAGSHNVDKYGGIPPFKETQNYVVKVMDYAGSELSSSPAVGTPSYSYSAGSSSANYQSDVYLSILQSILNFDSFSTDDYLLFLELIKNSMQNSFTAAAGADTSSDQAYQGLLFGNRIQTLF